MVNARMTEGLYGQIELNPPHWVLQERQLVNWGSYGGYHIFDPSTMFDGTVTLLTGQSESGKSTLVDAQVSLLYPTGAAFNKASNAGRSDRSDYSYLRGQRGIRNDNGHDEPVFLRGMTDDGEPYAVWGAIVDRYEDTTGGGTLSIAKFMTLPAGGRSEDVDKFFLVSRDPIDPRLMDDYRDDVFSVPLFKRVYHTATVYRQANLFHEDVWSRFGLTESACRLLHRMQRGPLVDGAVAEALALGWKGGIGRDTRAHYRDAGLAHLLAVSGCACGAQKPEEDDSLVVITSHVLTGDAATPEELLADMSLREKIGQMLMPDFSVYGDDTAPVYELNNAQTTAIAMDHFGGILLFSENIKDAEQTAKLIDAMQAANARTGRTALLIAADNEGGQISRLTMGTMLCGNMALGAANSEELTEEAAGLLSGEMAALGINVNFAPSLDVNSNPANPVIGVRAFSDDPQIVTRLGKAYVRGVQGKGIIPAVKHFPGHGNTETDSHTGLPRIDKSIAKLEECELIPFREAVESGVDILMTAHIQFPQIETDTYTSRKDGEQICLPATLSDDILTKMVRERFGYEGIIVTDAMNMDAIKENFAPLDAAKLAINAGVDMLLMPVATITDEQIYAVTDYIGGIEKLVESGEIPESRIDESVLRILKLKERYGLLTPLKPTEEETAAKAKAAAESVGSKANHEQEWDIAKQAVTLVKNEIRWNMQPKS